MFSIALASDVSCQIVSPQKYGCDWCLGGAHWYFTIKLIVSAAYSYLIRYQLPKISVMSYRKNLYKPEIEKAEFACVMKMAVFRIVVLCSLVEVYRRFRGACCRARLSYRPDDEGSNRL
jgi:hypothetical protein